MNPSMDDTSTSMNGHEKEASTSGDKVDVKVDMKESVGVGVLGFLFLIVLFALLRSQRRERKLLQKMLEMQMED